MEVIEKYFPHTSPVQKDQFFKLKELYTYWNAKVNVISRKDIDELYMHHVLHSLSIAKFITFLPGTRILDVGTGGGFPGIPLAIMFPATQFALVDSIGKKIRVVENIADTLKLQNVHVFQERAEQLNMEFDFTVSRAVTVLPILINWVKDKIIRNSQHEIPNGILSLKGGDLREELDLPYKVFIQNISD